MDIQDWRHWGDRQIKLFDKPIEPNRHSGDILGESFQKRCHMERIEDQMEFLLSAALYRCGNIADAEDRKSVV